MNVIIVVSDVGSVKLASMSRHLSGWENAKLLAPQVRLELLPPRVKQTAKRCNARLHYLALKTSPPTGHNLLECYLILPHLFNDSLTTPIIPPVAPNNSITYGMTIRKLFRNSILRNLFKMAHLGDDTNGLY